MEDEEEKEVQNAGGKWCLQECVSESVILLLRSVFENNRINWVLQGFSFQFTYSQAVKKLNVVRPRTANYAELMLEENQEEMAKELAWIVLYDMIYEKKIPNDLKISQSKIYNTLSIRFHELRKKTSTLTSLTCDSFILFWSSVVEATTFQIIFANFTDNVFYNNPVFVQFVDSSIRSILIGFVSTASSFHSLVWSLLTLRVQKYIPPTLIRKISAGDFKMGDSSGADIAAGFAEEKRFDVAKKQAHNILFHENSRTGLIENALKLSGTYAPVDEKVHSFKHGVADRSRVAITKVKAIKRESQNLIDKHIDARDAVLFDICDNEDICRDKIKEAKLKPLGFTFETFGFDTMCGKITMSVPQTTRGLLRSGVWKNFTRVKRIPKPIPTDDSLHNQIRKIHEDMEDNFYPELPQ